MTLVVLTRAKEGGAQLNASLIVTSNDIPMNLPAILSSGFVSLTASKYPDLVAGGLIFLVGANAPEDSSRPPGPGPACGGDQVDGSPSLTTHREGALRYATFLLTFVLPPVLMLGLLQKREPLPSFRHGRARAISATCLVALAYTTPWDNYLVFRGVWGYGSGQILGTLGYVPVEEYAFMILQPVMTALFLCILLGMPNGELHTGGRDSQRVRSAIAAVYGGLTVLGVGLLASGWERGLYLGLILAWAGPVLLGLWVYAAGVYLRVRIPFVLASSIPTLYLWVTDRFAIASGAWEISDRYTIGLSPLGLPVEEAIFFLLTNVLVVQGVLLFMNGPVERPAGVRSVDRAPSATGQVDS